MCSRKQLPVNCTCNRLKRSGSPSKINSGLTRFSSMANISSHLYCGQPLLTAAPLRSSALTDSTSVQWADSASAGCSVIGSLRSIHSPTF